MICIQCRVGARSNAEGFADQAAEAHEACKGGTWCDCQHYLKPGLVQR